MHSTIPVNKIMTGLLIIFTSLFQLQDTTTIMHSSDHSHTNRLIQSTSPYLLQHAHNPVDWFEWGEEALAKAKKEDKPILVSIGYSSCHWCHVMERESFENEDIASVMNEFFVCIKIDREERPDIDQIYMEAVQAMGINGGWPLNVFLTPDQKPFYGGTYFPPKSWVQVLTNIHKTYGTKRKEIETSAEDLKEALNRSDLDRFKGKSKETSVQEDVGVIFSKLSPSFDKKWGGFDRAPKFIMPSTWHLLLRQYHLTRNEDILDHTILTLKRIGMGGIYDQVGGGFARYSVDEKWFAPHFEKMLYDNSQLLSLYAEAYGITRDKEFKGYVEETYDWLLREMTHPDGGFYSALDADSEGEEGKFYVWTQEEFSQVLDKDSDLVGQYYNVNVGGNWEHGNNILMRTQSDSVFLKNRNVSVDEWDNLLLKTKTKLLNERSTRPRPGLDDKIITAWNAMMITGLTDAYRYMGDEKYLTAAEKNITFIENHLMDGYTLYRSYKGKHSATNGFLDDYAFIIQAYINLYQVTFNEAYLEKARELTSFTLKNFFDQKEQFFFYTHHEGEALISRKKEVFDNVIPSSNSVMARNLFQLGTLVDNEEWKSIARAMISSLSELIKNEPGYMSNWAIGLLEIKHPMAEVAIVGPDYEEFRAGFHHYYYPFSITMGTKRESSLPLLEGKVATGENTTFYVCFNKTCKLPVHSVSEALDQLNKSLRK